ncbi:hypothetical protein [Chondrinema litorale]|uniref:hypothetical protein n=1 Tax=Chondrinema litorale TaxID=2994555 RepID=UPI002543D7DA|nr:hypothetical protein [Chondrinema litorale]UZR93991.1 hypothetical protein OQ292_19280 [Chondrinema litorale]
MESLLPLTSVFSGNYLAKMNEFIISNEISALMIGFLSSTLFYYVLVLLYLNKKRYSNYLEGFFLSLSLGGAIFMFTYAAFPAIKSIMASFTDFKVLFTALVVIAGYLIVIPIIFKIIRKWNSMKVYIFEDE